MLFMCMFFFCSSSISLSWFQSARFFVWYGYFKRKKRQRTNEYENIDSFFSIRIFKYLLKSVSESGKKTEAALFMWKIFHSVLYPFGLFQNCRHLSENTNICICTTHDNAKHSIRLFSVWHSKNAHFFNILLWSFSVCFFFQSFAQSVLYFVQCYTHDQMIHIFCQTTHFVQLSVASTKSVRNHCRSNCRK